MQAYPSDFNYENMLSKYKQEPVTTVKTNNVMEEFRQKFYNQVKHSVMNGFSNAYIDLPKDLTVKEKEILAKEIRERFFLLQYYTCSGDFIPESRNDDCDLSNVGRFNVFFYDAL